ncbi:MAG: tetratricopeptide repeat protein [Bdellovibrionaceae bacterium]|nr:tetratricopeptide repeat protein [Pseudobdellovibrionaceae bacterium]
MARFLGSQRDSFRSGIRLPTGGWIVLVSFLVIGPAWAAPAAPASPKEIYHEAQGLFKKNDYAKTTALLWKNVERLDRAGIILLIKAHEAKKEWNDVIRAANLWLGKNNNDEEVLTFLGRAQFMRQRKPDEAKETLKKAIEVNPKYQPAYEVLAEIYEKNPYERRLLYQDMIEAFGPRADFLTKLCELNANDGENEQGEAVCKQAIGVNPKIADNHVYLGIIAKQKGEEDKAGRLLKAAADKFPSSELAQYEIAAYYESQKNWVDSAKYYEACLLADKNSERCLVGVGNSGIQLKKFERAHDAFQAACRRNGRKHTPIVRRAASSLRQMKALEWAEKLETVAERCAFQ